MHTYTIKEEQIDSYVKREIIKKMTMIAIRTRNKLLENIFKPSKIPFCRSPTVQSDIFKEKLK